MMRVLISIILFFPVFNISGQNSNDSIKVKIKRTYSKEKLIREEHYDQQGRLIRDAIPDYRYRRFSYYLEYDTLAWIYEYNEQAPQKKKYCYYVKDSIKSELELKEEHYYKKRLLKKIKNVYESDKPTFEYFKYNKYENVIRKYDTEFWRLSSRYKYVYNADLSTKRRTMYDFFCIKYTQRIIYEYNAFKNIEKIYNYNHDKKLTKIISYFYDEEQRLTSIETIKLDVYTAEHQRKDKKNVIFYKYNEYGLLIEEKKIDDHYLNDGYVYFYEYEYY